MKITPFITGILLFAFSLTACRQQPLAPLKIGDNMPNLILKDIVNYPGGTARLSDFEGKLLILDFWSTWCHPCVKAIPKFEKLQTEFGGQIQILLVASQPASDVIKCFTKRGIKLPSVTSDEKLSKLFPHKHVPHEVWIKDGKVLAITSEEAVNAANIKGLLSEKLLSLSEKKSNFYYDLTKPLLYDGNGGKATDMLYRSVFTGYLDGIGGSGVYTDSLNRFKLRALNGTVLQLYRSAMRFSHKRELAYTNRCILDFDEKEVLPPKDIPAYSPEARDKYYCYELIVPEVLKPQASSIMLDDLNRFFGALYNLYATIEKRQVKCWALKKTESFKGLDCKSATAEVITSVPGVLDYRKQPFSTFYKAIAGLYRHEPLPVINKTGISSEIDISFPSREKDIQKFSSYLEKYGLKLEQDICNIDMLVIKQSK